MAASPETGGPGGSDANREAWNSEAYSAWLERFGTPGEAARRIAANPRAMLSSLKDDFGDVRGKRILNMMGSNGVKATALALLGAEVTVVDFSEENRRYALDVAAAAGAEITYEAIDILRIRERAERGSFDIVFAEMGILHYFLDLRPFMDIARDMLADGGLFVLKDFHPVSTKLISYRGSTAKVRKYKVSGDYFDEGVENVEVAFSKFLKEGDEKRYVSLRRWTLGEIVTSIAQAGLTIRGMKEEPNRSGDVFDKGIPKTFTIVARKWPMPAEGKA